ncbi:ABC transporter transmembrane domain-containing protein [Acinetobacter ursingii]|uniref:ABC transporter transmembrane domain-containing protein n=1 Tax=Acinetobacter ursingii TaxID=108980 RepID=UPI00208EEBCE|nr:ABC transporter transmembrane domain-containing protein [Acinetobacter ursingii]
MQRYSRLKLDFILMFLLVVFVAIFGTLFPYLMKLLVDQVEQTHHIEIAHLFSIEKLYLLVLAYAAAWLMSQLLSWCQNLFSMIMSVNFETALMYSGVENFLALQKQHQDQTEIGAFLTDLQRGASEMSEMTFAFFMLLGPIVFQLLFIFVVLFKTINIVFSACFVGTALLIFIVSILINPNPA